MGTRGPRRPSSSEDEDEKRERQWKNETKEEAREKKKKKEREEKVKLESIKRNEEARKKHAEEEKRKEEEWKKEEEELGEEKKAKMKTMKRRAQRRALEEKRAEEQREKEEREAATAKRMERQKKEREEDKRAVAEMPDSAILDLETWVDSDATLSDRDLSDEDGVEFEWNTDGDHWSAKPKYTDEEKAKMTFKERLEKCGEIRMCDEEQAKGLVAEWEADGIPLEICESWRSRGYEGHVAVPEAKPLVAQYTKNRATLSRIWRLAGFEREILDKMVLKTLKVAGVKMFWELFPEELRNVVRHARNNGEAGVGKISRCRRRRDMQYRVQAEGIGDIRSPNNLASSSCYDDRTIIERQEEEKRWAQDRKRALAKQRSLIKANGGQRPSTAQPAPLTAAPPPAPLAVAPQSEPLTEAPLPPPRTTTTTTTSKSVGTATIIPTKTAPPPQSQPRRGPPPPPNAMDVYWRIQRDLERHQPPPRPFRPFPHPFGEHSYTLEKRDTELKQKEKLNRMRIDVLNQQLKKANHEGGLLRAERKQLNTLKSKVNKVQAEIRADRERRFGNQNPSSSRGRGRRGGIRSGPQRGPSHQPALSRGEEEKDGVGSGSQDGPSPQPALSRGEEEKGGISSGPQKGPSLQPALFPTPPTKRRKIIVTSPTEEKPPFSHFPSVENRASECVWDTRNYDNPGHRPCTNHWCMFCGLKHPIHFEQIRDRRVVDVASNRVSDDKTLQEILDPVTAEEEEELLGAVGGAE